MSRIYTQKQLISKLKELKQIKPTNEWVTLSKMNILGSDAPAYREVLQTARQASFSNILTSIFQRKLAYAFAVLLLVFVGAVGVLKYQTSNTLKVAGSLQSDVVAQNTLKSNLQDFKLKSQNLADAIKDGSQNSSLAIKEVKDAAQTLTDAIQKNPTLAKTIALDVNNSKTVLDTPGGSEGSGLKEAINNPYKALVEQLIKDEKGMKLTPDQQMVLDSVEKLHEQGKDPDALVNLVLLVKSTDSQATP